MALRSKGHLPTAENIALLVSIEARFAGEGGVTLVAVTIDTAEYVVEHTVGASTGRRRGLSRALPGRRGRQAICRLHGHRVARTEKKDTYFERAMDTGTSPEACREGRQRGAVGL